MEAPLGRTVVMQHQRRGGRECRWRAGRRRGGCGDGSGGRDGWSGGERSGALVTELGSARRRGAAPRARHEELIPTFDGSSSSDPEFGGGYALDLITGSLNEDEKAVIPRGCPS